MNLEELTIFLIKCVLKDEQSVSVRAIEDDEFINIEVVVSEDSMGAIIGRGGSTINSIRNIVNASSYANDLKRVKINVEAF